MRSAATYGMDGSEFYHFFGSLPQVDTNREPSTVPQLFFASSDVPKHQLLMYLISLLEASQTWQTFAACNGLVSGGGG